MYYYPKCKKLGQYVLVLCFLLGSSIGYAEVRDEEQRFIQRNFNVPPQIFLIGYSHSDTTSLPTNMIENIGYFKALGFDHLVLEMRPSTPEAQELTKYLAMPADYFRHGSLLDIWFGKNFVYFV